jgi:hypothetical protein
MSRSADPLEDDSELEEDDVKSAAMNDRAVVLRKDM